MKQVKVTMNDQDYFQAKLFAANRGLDVSGRGVSAVLNMALRAYLNKYAAELKDAGTRENELQRAHEGKLGNFTGDDV